MNSVREHLLRIYQAALAGVEGESCTQRALTGYESAKSCIKGGRLAQRLAGRKTSCLMISDVPGNAPQTIGSGFLSSPKGNESPLTDLPEWIKDLPKAPPAPSPTDVCYAGELLQASGDLIVTGPSGTNVMDLMLAIKLP